ICYRLNTSRTNSIPSERRLSMPLAQQFLAELIGTFWLVFGGCGSAVLAGVFQSKDGIQVGIGLHGISLAFGLTVLTMAYAIGHISGCHLNPAVSVGLCVGRRFPASKLIAYILAQVIGAIIAAGIIYLISSGPAGVGLAFDGVGCYG